MSATRRRLVEDIEIEYAARPRKPGTGAGDTMRTQHFLHQPKPRPPWRPELVVVPAMVNGRRLEPWEAGLYVEWAHRERWRELVMFEGLIG